ncbi:MAG: hypothetical protein JJ979_02340 [Roseibium sp.]|nr:hypothetical protein [Roseibium sp.]
MDKKSDPDQEEGVLDSVASANNAASKGPLSALLTPTFEILGKEAGDWTQRLINNRKVNKAAHIDAVRQEIGESENEPSELMLENLLQWEERASLFDEEDEESALWRGILDEILTTKTDHKEIIEIAKSLNRYDLRALQMVGGFWDAHPWGETRWFRRVWLGYALIRDAEKFARKRGSYNKLIEKNVFFTSKQLSFNYTVILLTFICAFLVFSVSIKIEAAIFSSDFFSDVSIADLGLFFAVAAALISVYPMKKVEELAHLTFIGKRIYRAMKKYVKNPIEEER